MSDRLADLLRRNHDERTGLECEVECMCSDVFGVDINEVDLIGVDVHHGAITLRLWTDVDETLADEIKERSGFTTVTITHTRGG